MHLSDLFIGSHIMTPWVYGSVFIIFVIGRLIKKNNILNLLTCSVISSILFFIITNFGVWISGGYSYSLEGLIICYTMAIPFFKNTLTSTVLFTAMFYSLHYFLHSLTMKYQKNNI